MPRYFPFYECIMLFSERNAKSNTKVISEIKNFFSKKRKKITQFGKKSYFCNLKLSSQSMGIWFSRTAIN